MADQSYPRNESLRCQIAQLPPDAEHHALPHDLHHEKPQSAFLSPPSR
ncbi:Uncharacterised protein [Vibrio cholerae]|nr:Uncharacterised protein [Vibrio cholerae]